MDSVKRNIYSHGKEFYKADADFYARVYEEKIYYMNSEYLCYSDTDGGDIRIITGEKRYKNAYIYVNPTGIYYKRGSTNTYLDVKRIEFDGSSVLEVKEKGRFSYVYIIRRQDLLYEKGSMCRGDPVNGHDRRDYHHGVFGSI